MGFKNILFGKAGEDIATDFLKKNNYKILEKNYRKRCGEVDIVAQDKETVCFIEVKMRRSDEFGRPEEAVSNKKQRQISKAALCYLKENKFIERSARFDVVSIVYKGKTPDIDLIKNAFSLPDDYAY